MKVRIDQREETKTWDDYEEKKGFFGTKKIPVKKSATLQMVYLFLEASEEEKAIIKANGLDESVVETVGLSQQQIQRYESEIENAPNKIERDLAEHIYQYQRANPIEFTLKHYLEGPYQRAFDNVVQSNEYVSKLKTVYLPKIKKIMEANAKVGPSTESFDL